MTTAFVTDAPKRTGPPAAEPTDSNWARLLNYRIRVNDRSAYDHLYRDVFRRGIYHFESRCRNPRIIDFGCGIGMSILYFKHVYPTARVVAFEPDAATRCCLVDNVKNNNLQDVTLVPPALAKGPRETSEWGERLADLLTEPVEFLKLTLGQGAWDLLDACGGRLHQVRLMAIEYHHRPAKPRTLHRILGRLDELDFDYLIAEGDSRENQDLRPPYWVTSATRYNLLIHAARRERATPA